MLFRFRRLFFRLLLIIFAAFRFSMLFTPFDITEDYFFDLMMLLDIDFRYYFHRLRHHVIFAWLYRLHYAMLCRRGCSP